MRYICFECLASIYWVYEGGDLIVSIAERNNTVHLIAANFAFLRGCHISFLLVFQREKVGILRFVFISFSYSLMSAAKGIRIYLTD